MGYCWSRTGCCNAGKCCRWRASVNIIRKEERGKRIENERQNERKRGRERKRERKNAREKGINERERQKKKKREMPEEIK